MISFLNPWFLAALAGAVAPLLLHLLQRRQSSRMKFSTIRFLVLAQKRSSSRIRMEHWLLWFLRTLLLILLALGFAMPMLRTSGFGKILGQAGRDVAIVLDASYSMNYVKNGIPVWETARNTAEEIIAGLGNRDRICIFLAEDTPVPVLEQLSGDFDQGVSLLRRREETGLGTSDLPLAVEAAREALSREERRREREIHILTDNQALPWRKSPETPSGNAGRPETEPPGKAPASGRERPAVFATLLGVDQPIDAAPEDVTVSPPLIRPGTPITLDLSLFNIGPVGESAVTVRIDEREVAGRAVNFTEPGRLRLRMTLPPLEPGLHAAVLQLPEDNLNIDNRLYFLIEVTETLPALCVGTPESTFFVRAALATGEKTGAGIEARHLSREALSGQTPRDAACIFLCDLPPLSGQEILSLERYVRAGGFLVVFPGDNASPDDYKTWEILPGVPERVVSVPRSERRRTLRWREPTHPLLREFAPESRAPEITVRRELRWKSPLPDAVIPLITAGPDLPFLLLRPEGRGHVAMFSVTPDREWSDFPLSPFFLPILHQASLFGAGASGQPPFFEGPQAIDLERHLPHLSAGDTLRDPRGRPVPLRMTQVEGRRVFDAGILRVPGIYTLSAGGNAPPTPALAVNLPRAESDLTPVAPENIPELLGEDIVFTASSKEELARRIAEHRIGRTFGEHLLWLALIVAALEVFYANRLCKSAPRLSESLNVEASGKVKGKGIGGVGQ